MGGATFSTLSLSPYLPLLLAVLWLPLRRRRVAPLLLLVFFCSLGFARFQESISPPLDPSHISQQIQQEPVLVDARIAALEARPEGGATVELEAIRLGRPTGWTTVHGTIRLSIRQGQPPFLPGDLVRFQSRLRKPARFGTPGEFDYPRHLANRHIFATAAINEADDLVLLHGAPPAWPALMERQRAATARFIGAVVEPSSGSLVRALTIGDKGGIPLPLRQLLARGGVSHLFAISGLHLGLVTLALFTLSSGCYRRSERLLLIAPPARLLPALLLPVLLLYLAWTGNAISTQRAWWMCAAGVVLLIRSRRTSPLHVLLVAVFILLWLSPLALFEPSFQLSVAGVGGILLMVPPCRPWLEARPRALRACAGLTLATVAATLATLPLVLFHFHLLAPAGVLANLAAIPLVGLFAVPLGLAGCLLLPWWPTAAALLFQGCGLLLGLLLDLLNWITGLPGLQGINLFLSLMDIFGISLLCLGLLLSVQRQRWQLTLVFLASGTLFLTWPAADRLNSSVTAFSVGQGESLLLTRAGPRHYLIDGGGLFSESFDTGERLVAPALGRLGVRQLEAVVMTHNHPDHRRGLSYILDHFPVKAFWYGANQILDAELTEILARRKIPRRIFARGWTWVDSNPRDALAVFLATDANLSENDQSLVLYAGNERDGVLLTADLEQEGVTNLLNQQLPGPVTLFKLPHHGSRHSTPWRLLDVLLPRIAFVSDGWDNRFGFPHQETLDALSSRGIPLYRTDSQGSLQFVLNPQGWTFQSDPNWVFR